jgi:hypothetical protein
MVFRPRGEPLGVVSCPLEWIAQYEIGLLQGLQVGLSVFWPRPGMARARAGCSGRWAGVRVDLAQPAAVSVGNLRRVRSRPQS